MPLSKLPQRVYLGRRGHSAVRTTRYFVHKLPIGMQSNTPTVTFVVLVTDTGGQLLSQFLQDHLPLLGLLPHWRIVAVVPGHVAGLPTCEAVFKRFRTTSVDRWSAAQKNNLRFAFGIRNLADGNEGLGSVTVADIDRFHRIRDTHGASAFEKLLLRWRASGDSVFEDQSSERFREAVAAGRGQLEIHRLPIRYDRFGTRAGVS